MKWMRYNGVWKDYDTGTPVKVAPLQANPRGDQIPWDVAAEGYKEYAAQYGTSQSLERLCERGGFGATELAILLYERIKRIEQPRMETSPALPFTHWSKDPLIPYEGCRCSSCDDARSVAGVNMSDGTASNR